MPEHHEVLVIGGGQAGLAVGYHLARRGRSFVILEAAGAPAAAWRSRWDSLRLFTPARYDSLPGLRFPAEPDHHPTRDEVVAYLTDYAQRFELPVRFDSRVTAVRPDRCGYRVEVGDRACTAGQVVIATGAFQTPRLPALAADLGAGVHQLHSSDYRAPDQIPGGPVLVVGAGNTGLQIAEDLAATHAVHLAIGSRQAPLPQRILGRDVFAYLEALGVMRITAGSRLGRRLCERETLIGTSPRAVGRMGVRRHGRAVAAAGATVTFADAGTLSPRTVVWATGFRRDFTYVHVPVFDDRGHPVHDRGVTRAPGLYVLGMPWQHTRGSALLGWVKDDAEHLAGRIDSLAATAPNAGAAAAA